MLYLQKFRIESVTIADVQLQYGIDNLHNQCKKLLFGPTFLEYFT